MTAMENAVRDGLTYDADAVVLPVKCTGLVKVSYLLKLFAKGMRGVLVLGCDEGDCRYYNGSARCAEIVDETREILDLAGIKPDRLQFHMIAESGGREAKRVLKGFLKQVGMTVVGKKPKGPAKKTRPAGPKVKKRSRKRKAAAGTKRRAGGTRTAKADRKQAAGARKRKRTAGARARRKAAGTGKPTRGTRAVKARKGK